MSETATSLVILALMLVGVGIGLALRTALPGHHLSEDSKGTVTLVAGLVATLTALVLGLLVSAAEVSFETERSALNQIAAQIIVLDRMMAAYGPEAKVARERLRSSVLLRIDLIWPADGWRPAKAAFTSDTAFESVQAALRDLPPGTDVQKGLRTQALDTADRLAQARWLFLVQGEESAIPVLFMVALGLWLTAIFTSFSLFAPRHATTVAALFVGAASVTGAVFLILELGSPYGGAIRLSPEPMRIALEHLGR